MAPPTLKAALVGIYLMIALVVANIVTAQAIAPSVEIVVEDLVIVAAFLAIVVGVSRRAMWARYTGVAVAVVFAIAALAQLRGGVPGVFIAVYVGQLLVLIGVAVLLLLPVTGDWFHGLD